eukprot:TRINITY_DN2161_c0_g1_i1.p1 TRINITY_DN2161_c0_g1~~TRINITY_DN2161_c0_g1_i1.p1  ORF type:complete len:516 (+),score=127.56 TRINITY_DN2161_c0_g1_i1:77-1624(+)
MAQLHTVFELYSREKDRVLPTTSKQNSLFAKLRTDPSTGPSHKKEKDVLVSCHTYIPSLKLVVLGMSDGSLLTWTLTRPPNEAQVDERKAPRKFTPRNGHKGTIHAMLWLTAHNVLATGSADRSIKIWDLTLKDQDKACVQTISEHDGTVLGLCSFDSERMLVSCGTDRKVKVWAPEEGRQLLLYPWFVQVCELPPFSGWVRALCAVDGDLVVGEDSGHVTVIRFQLTKGYVGPKSRGARRYLCHTMGVTGLHFLTDNLVVSTSFDCTAKVTDLRTGLKRLVVTNPFKKRWVGIGCFPEAQEMYLVDEVGRLEIWALLLETQLGVHQVGTGPKPAVGGLSYAGGPGHDVVFVQTNFGTTVCHFDRDVPHKELEGHTGPVIAICSVESAAHGMDTPPRRLEDNGEEEEAAAAEEEPQREMSMLELAQLEEEEEATSMAGSEAQKGIDTMAVISASVDNTIRNWDPQEMVCRITLNETGSELRSMVYAPVNRLICTGNDDGTIRIWHPDVQIFRCWF